MDNGLKSLYSFRLSAPLFPYGIERMKTKKQDHRLVSAFWQKDNNMKNFLQLPSK